MAIVEKDQEQHVTEALANLLEQFRDKTSVERFLDIYIRQVADLERVFFELAELRFLDTAEGAQLDGIGQIVGEARQSRADPEYRIALSVRITLNLSQGLREDIIEIILGILGPSTTVEIEEYYPAAFLARILDPIDPAFDETQIGNFVKSAKAAGVNGISTFFVTGPFQFDTGLGWDDGKFGGAI
jgi:hypothetical protein